VSEAIDGDTRPDGHAPDAGADEFLSRPSIQETMAPAARSCLKDKSTDVSCSSYTYPCS